MLSRQQFDLMLDLRIYVAFVYTLGSAQLLVVTMDTNKSLNASRIAVGTASDLALQVRCTTNSTNATSWTNEDGSTVSQGLNPFGISQEDGILRVYPVNLLSEGPNIFSCSDELETLAVQFDRRKCNNYCMGIKSQTINMLVPQVHTFSLPHQYQSKLQQQLM